jgi:hypothetical protein
MSARAGVGGDAMSARTEVGGDAASARGSGREARR